MTRLQPAEKAWFRFFHQVRVRWAEVDAQGIVFNAQYYFLFDVAMTEFLREAGLRPDRADGGGRAEMFTASSMANFHAAARFDDLLDMGVGVERLGRTSVTMAIGVWRGDTLLTTGRMVYVSVDPEAHTPVDMPDTIRGAFAPWRVPQAATP